MSEQDAASRAVTLTRVFDAPIELVYRAWAEPEHVQRWMKCDVKAALEVENWAPAVGAVFKTHMSQPGVFETRGTGRFTHVDPPNLLAWVTDADAKLGVPEMTVRVELTDLGGKTELTLTQTGIPNDMICDVINGGWTAGMAQLQTVIADLLSADTPMERLT